MAWVGSNRLGNRLASMGIAAALLLAAAGGCDDTSNGAPVLTCAASAECPSGSVCSGGVCRLPGSAVENGPCFASRDCATGLYCSELGVCAKAGGGVEGADCGSDAACQGGLRCVREGLGGSCAKAGTVEDKGQCAGDGDCLAGLYCSSAQRHCTSFAEAFKPFAGVQCQPDEARFHSFFEIPREGKYPPDFFRLPFPNDARVKADGTLDLGDFPRPGPSVLGPDLVALYVDTWAREFAGFGSTAVVTFRLSSNPDFSSANADVVQFVDLTAGPTFGQALGRGWSWFSGRNKYTCQQIFTVRNALESPLLPGHTYAALLLTGLPDGKGLVGEKGDKPQPDADLAAVLAASRPGSDPALGRAWDQYKPLRDYLAGKSLALENVANAAVFTVQDTTGGMKQIAAAVAAQAAPTLSDLTLCDTGVKSPCDDGTPAHACGAASADFHEVHGRIALPIFQKGTIPYEKPSDGGAIEFANGAAKVQSTEKVCFSLAVPKGTMPAGGWPLVVYHHGTSGSMRSFVLDGTAKTITTGAKPAAILGFDAVCHGARRGASKVKSDNLVFNVLNPAAARDNLLQGAADVLTALRAVELTVDAQSLPSIGEIKFDATRLAFFGHSQGGTSGEIALAYAPVEIAVLSGAGAFLTDSLLTKTSPVNIPAGLQLIAADKLDDGHAVMTIFQSFFERSDPINYAPLLVRAPPAGVPSKHLFFSFGVGDTYSTPATMKRNVDALGIPQAPPMAEAEDKPMGTRPITGNVGAGDGKNRTALYVKYQPSGYDGHFVTQRNPQAVADWSGFLESWLETGTPTLK